MKKAKKLLAVIMVFIMMLCVIPMSIFASTGVYSGTPAGVFVAGVKVDGTETTYWLNDGQGSITSTGASNSNYNVKYIPGENNGTGSLVLKNATLGKSIVWESENYTGASSKQKLQSAVIYAQLPTAITLEGESTVTSESALAYDDSHTGYGAYGIFGVSEIIGSGSVEVNVTANRPQKYFTHGTLIAGIESTGTFMIHDKATVNVTAELLGTFVTNTSTTATFAIRSGSINIRDKAVVKAVSDREDATPRENICALMATNGGILVADKADLFASSESAFSGGLTVNGGTVELVSKKQVGVISLGGDLDPIVTVNSEATAEGAEKITDFGSQIGGYRYVKIEHYSKFVSTFRQIGRSIKNVMQTIISVMAFLAKMAPVVFQSFAKFPGIFTIVYENFVFMIQSYLADAGIVRA